MFDVGWMPAGNMISVIKCISVYLVHKKGEVVMADMAMYLSFEHVKRPKIDDMSLIFEHVKIQRAH